MVITWVHDNNINATTKDRHCEGVAECGDNNDDRNNNVL